MLNSKVSFIIAILCGSVALSGQALASGSATDTTPGASKSGLGGGGGGGGSKPSPAPAPKPAPAPIISAALTFTPQVSYGNVTPQCTGSYRIDPYYPTLSLLTISAQTSLVNVPDGTTLYVYANATSGTLYPFTSNVMIVTAQSGTVSWSVYVTPGTTISSVTVTDASGTIIFVGS